MIRRRTEHERAAARLRRLNDAPEPRARRHKRRLPFPEPGAIRQLFSEARRIR